MDEMPTVNHDKAGIASCDRDCYCGRSDGTASGTDRRTFLAHGAAALAMLALAACNMGNGPTSPGTVSAATIKLSDNPSLANVGGVAVVSIGGSPVAIVRETATAFSAFSLICPHAGNTVQPSGTQGFYCPGHGAQFDLMGRWIGGQPTTNLTSYPVKYNATAGSLTIGN